IQQLNDLKAPIFYLVTTVDRAKQLMKSGWSDRNFYYNRAADAVVRNDQVSVRIDGPMDDALIGVLYAPSATPADRAKQLTEDIARTETDYANFINARAKQMAGMGFAKLVHELAVAPENPKDDQRWFGL